MSNEIKPTTSKRPSAIEHDDSGWIDALLNNDAAASPSIADDGFTAALMSSLPAPAHRWRYRWIVPMMAIAGFIVGMGLLSGGEDLSMVLGCPLGTVKTNVLRGKQKLRTLLADWAPAERGTNDVQ